MPNDLNLILVTRERLHTLLAIEAEYYALHDMGVDNWYGYGEIDWEEVEERAAQAIAELP